MINKPEVKTELILRAARASQEKIDSRFDDVTQSTGRFSVRPCVRMRRGGSPFNALAEGCSLGRAGPYRRRARHGGQYRDGDNTEIRRDRWPDQTGCGPHVGGRLGPAGSVARLRWRYP